MRGARSGRSARKSGGGSLRPWEPAKRPQRQTTPKGRRTRSGRTPRKRNEHRAAGEAPANGPGARSQFPVRPATLRAGRGARNTLRARKQKNAQQHPAPQEQRPGSTKAKDAEQEQRTASTKRKHAEQEQRTASTKQTHGKPRNAATQRSHAHSYAQPRAPDAPSRAGAPNARSSGRRGGCACRPSRWACRT